MEVNMSEDAFRTSRVLKVLGNPLRYRIYELIGEEGPLSSGELSNRLNRKIDSISYHVDKMKKLDLIYSEKQGKQNYHHLKRSDLYGSIKAFEVMFNRE